MHSLICVADFTEASMEGRGVMNVVIPKAKEDVNSLTNISSNYTNVNNFKFHNGTENLNT